MVPDAWNGGALLTVKAAGRQGAMTRGTSMSHRDRQPSAGTAVAALPPKSGPSAVAVPRFFSLQAETVFSGSHWESLCRAASPAQQAELLALATRQGFLYTGQVPVAAAPIGDHNGNHHGEPTAAALLTKLLAGQLGTLDALRPTAVAFLDEALDESQRAAGAAALATTDLFLIQGGPGSGKSRLAAEIVTQAARRGDRILLASAHAAGLDRVLEQIASRDGVCPLRLLGSAEALAALSPAVRELTFAQRTSAIRERTLQTARETRAAAEMQCARRRHEEPIWGRLEELAVAHAAAQTEIADAEAKLGAVEAEVWRRIDDVEAPCRAAHDVRALRKAAHEKTVQLVAEAETAKLDLQATRDAEVALQREIDVVAPLADAKRHGRWWTWRWWQATFQGRVLEKSNALQGRRGELRAKIDECQRRGEEAARTQQAVAAETAATAEAMIQTEVRSRQQKLRQIIEQHHSEGMRRQALWADLCRQIDSEYLQPSAQTGSAVREARESWLRQRKEDEGRCSVAREWADYLEGSAESLADRLPGYANVIAATPAALAEDRHFADAAPAGLFDLLVLDEAEQLSEAELLKLARRARRCVFMGLPALASDALSVPAVAAGNRRETTHPRPCFHKAWKLLACDAPELPYTWGRERNRLTCKLRSVAPEHRGLLETEPLADAPDVELRILALPGQRPILAEVVFPAEMALAEAKEFLFRELQEITVQPAGQGIRWFETPEAVCLRFGHCNEPGKVAADLGSGVSEILGGLGGDRTAALSFACNAGWDRAGAERWVQQHLHLRDLGRTARLATCWRMARSASLQAVVHDLLAMDCCQFTGAASAESEVAVEFVAVGCAKPKNGARTDTRGSRRPEQGRTHAPGGAGLETDLATLRPGDRIPPELKQFVGLRGLVNLMEARTVVRKLEELVAPAPANGRKPPVFVVALYQAQADLISSLIRQSPRLGQQAESIAVGVPGTFRQRETDVVVVSLTRSQTSRAVPYGDGPSALLLAWTRARRKLVLVGDPGNLLRRAQWQGSVDSLDEHGAAAEGRILARLASYLQGQGHFPSSFRLCEGGH
jgi:hypothetical protein